MNRAWIDEDWRVCPDCQTDYVADPGQESPHCPRCAAWHRWWALGSVRGWTP